MIHPPDDPTACTAAELAAHIREGRLSARAVIDAHLARLAALNPVMNAVTVPLDDAARAAADAADAAAKAGAPLGPLHGVPFTVKENLDCVGSATTHGVWALRRAMPYADAPIVARMKAAGAIPIGRTNLSEMGLRLDTDNPLRGRTRNPFDPKLTIGGSSGGDAAAVATGMAPIGLGNDMGGSLRIPAFCAGVAALKPTLGRVPHGASLPPHDYGLSGQLMLAHGPIARGVADLRIALGVIAGRDPRDPRSVDAPLIGPDVERRAGLVVELPGGPLPADYVDAVRRAGAALEAAGWQVEEVDPPDLAAVEDVWTGLIVADFETMLPQMQPFISDALAGHLERIVASTDGHRMSTHRLHAERSRLGRVWSGAFADHPVMIGPNWTRRPWPVDADLDPDGGLDLLRDSVRFTMPGNALGLPCLALPTGCVDGRPTGVQIYADLWREDLCLAAGAVVEAAVGRPEPIEPR